MPSQARLQLSRVALNGNPQPFQQPYTDPYISDNYGQRNELHLLLSLHPPLTTPLSHFPSLPPALVPQNHKPQHHPSPLLRLSLQVVCELGEPLIDEFDLARESRQLCCLLLSARDEAVALCSAGADSTVDSLNFVCCAIDVVYDLACFLQGCLSEVSEVLH